MVTMNLKGINSSESHYCPPSDDIKGKDADGNDRILTFMNKVEGLSQGELIGRINLTGKYARTPIFLPETYDDRFVTVKLDLSDVRENKELEKRNNVNPNDPWGFNTYSNHTLHSVTIRDYGKHTSVAVSNNSYSDLYEVDILTGKKDLIKKSISSQRGEIVINVSEIDYTDEIKSSDKICNEDIGRKYFNIDMKKILKDNKFLYIPELGKIYYSAELTTHEALLVVDLIARFKNYLEISFSHDATMDCKIAISCQDAIGSLSELYAIVDDEIVKVNIYDVAGINTALDGLDRNALDRPEREDESNLSLNVTRRTLQHDNSRIWITNMLFDKETNNIVPSIKSCPLTMEMYNEDIFVIEDITFSKDYETIKEHRDTCRKNVEKFNKEHKNTIKELKELREKYLRDVGVEKDFKSLSEACDVYKKRNDFLIRLINYIGEKIPDLYGEIKRDFINIESDNKALIKLNEEALDDIIIKDRETLKHEFEMEAKKTKHEHEKERHKNKVDVEKSDAQHKISIKTLELKTKKGEYKTKTFSGKVEIIKVLGTVIKFAVPLIIGGLAFIFGMGKMRS